MFKKRTLFVVGAGASAEYGLPVGTGLAATISKKLDVKYDRFGREPTTGDIELWQQIQYAHQQEVTEYQNAAWLIRDGVLLSNSIDDFLDVHAENLRAVKIGKAAIVRSILEAERSSKLFFDKSNIYNKFNFSKIEGTWLIKLMRVLGRGVPPQQAKSMFKNVSFVVFNYDRCIEHFFFTALKQFYNFTDPQAAEVVQELRIFHPYGRVAPLPHEDRGGIEYGGSADRLSAQYVKLSSSIRSYTEQVDDGDEIALIRAEVQAAEKIVFLGFAFHDQNMSLLKPLAELGRKHIYGTAYNMSSSDVDVVKSQLTSYFNQRERQTIENKIFLESAHKCADIFDFYGKSLPA